MANGLDIQIQKKGNKSTIVHVLGSVDSETHEDFSQFVAPLVGNQNGKILVDMQKCEYVSSAGIRALFDFRKQVTDRRGAISFFNLQPQIKKVFEIVKALPLECVFANEEEADAYLDRMMAEEFKKQSDAE